MPPPFPFHYDTQTKLSWTGIRAKTPSFLVNFVQLITQQWLSPLLRQKGTVESELSITFATQRRPKTPSILENGQISRIQPLEKRVVLRICCYPLPYTAVSRNPSHIPRTYTDVSAYGTVFPKISNSESAKLIQTNPNYTILNWNYTTLNRKLNQTNLTMN